MQREMSFEGEASIKKLQEFLGKRPGGYRIDPFYIRTGIAHKPYFWDDYNRKWVMVKVGDKFYFDDEGIAVREPVARVLPTGTPSKNRPAFMEDGRY